MRATIDLEAIDGLVNGLRLGSEILHQDTTFEPGLYWRRHIPPRACDQTSDVAEAYVSGALTPGLTYEFELHFMGCEVCLNRVEADRAAIATLRRSGRQHAVVQRRRCYGWR